MEVFSIKQILQNFYGLTRDLSHADYKRQHRKFQVKQKDEEILKHFFSGAEVCFDEGSKYEYRQAVSSFFQRINQNPVDHIEVTASIENIEQYLEKLRDDTAYPKFLAILKEYEFHN